MTEWQIVTPTAVPLRDVWPYEQRDFSRWMKENVGFLNERLTITIDAESVQAEAAVESFAVDLYATATDDETGDEVTVVIENQLEQTDHDHLGKVLTYASHYEADCAVWIASYARPAHVKAVQWLNDNSNLTVWLLQVEAVKITEQHVAPLLRKIVGPSPLPSGARRTASRSRDPEEVAGKRAFWEAVLDVAAPTLHSRGLFTSHAAGANNHMSTFYAQAGLQHIWQMWVTSHGAWCCLRLRHEDGEEAAAAAFDPLLAVREQIEDDFGGELTFQAKEGVSSRQIRWDSPVEVGFRDDHEDFPAAARALTEGMARLYDAATPHLQ